MLDVGLSFKWDVQLETEAIASRSRYSAPHRPRCMVCDRAVPSSLAAPGWIHPGPASASGTGVPDSGNVLSDQPQKHHTDFSDWCVCEVIRG